MSGSFKKRWIRKGRLRTEFRDAVCIGTIVGFDNKDLAVLRSEKKLGDILEDGGKVYDIKFDKINVTDSPGTSGCMAGFIYNVLYDTDQKQITEGTESQDSEKEL